MGLPNSYTMKTGALLAYFEAILNAEPPERFSYAFVSSLDFTSSNDRLIVGILKELGFLNADAVPQERYYQFLDKTRSWKILADGIREMYSDLFAVNKNANELNRDEVVNKLRTLYKGTKKDTVIKHIARTFSALCDLADFERPTTTAEVPKTKKSDKNKSETSEMQPTSAIGIPIELDSLQYHINIVLPESRDQAVYDAIFKSLRDHLG